MNSNGQSMRFYALPIFGFLIMAFFKVSQAQPLPPAPAPSNDSTAIDQGIAYVLLLVALAVTYLFH
ncbi:Arabinogalactan protein 16 [Bienertia sinuspersici]